MKIVPVLQIIQIFIQQNYPSRDQHETRMVRSLGEAELETPGDEELTWCLDTDLQLIQRELIISSFDDILTVKMLRSKLY